MNSESGQRLSVEELKRLNQPPTTPVPTTPPSSPMRQDWNDLLAALGALYQQESTNSDRLERLEASVGAQVALLREISAPAGKYPTQAQLEALAQDVAQIREILQPAGKKRGRSFSLPQDFPVKDLLAQSPGLSLAGGPAWNPDSGLPGSGGLDLFLQMG